MLLIRHNYTHQSSSYCSLISIISMDAEYAQAEKNIDEMERILEFLINNRGDLENLENNIETNLETAKVNKELAYAVSSLYLAQKKLNNQLKKEDPVLGSVKKVQDRAERITKVETAGSKKQAVDQKVFTKHFVKTVKK